MKTLVSFRATVGSAEVEMRNRTPPLTTFLLSMGLLVCACHHCDGVPKGFFSLPNERRHSEFMKLDFETQYKVYLCGMHYEPPYMELGSYIGDEGGRVVWPLRARLERVQDEPEIWFIIMIFGDMASSGSYDVAGDKSLMDQLKAKVGEMNGPIKNYCQKDLDRIVREARIPKDFFSLPIDQQVSTFSKLDFETQYAVYLSAVYREWPNPQLRAAFAREGAVVVQPLREKLEATQDELTIRDIFYVFCEMNSSRSYDVAGDRSLMTELRTKVGATRMWKDSLEKDYDALAQEHPEASP